MEWKPDPERFSIAEVLAHLAHAEQYTYRVKYKNFARQESKVIGQ